MVPVMRKQKQLTDEMYTNTTGGETLKLHNQRPAYGPPGTQPEVGGADQAGEYELMASVRRI